MTQGEGPLFEALYVAARRYALFDDLRGDICEACAPKAPEKMIAAREALADALDAIHHARALRPKGAS